MENLLSIVQNATETNREHCQLLLNALEEHQSYRLTTENAIDATISKINNQLQGVTTRAAGFKLLIDFLPHCSGSILDQRGLVWISTAIKCCSQRNPIDAVPIAYDVVRSLIHVAATAPDFNKTITHSLMQKLIESVWEVPDNALIPSLKCLIECMHRYPGPCGPSKNIVEKVVLSLIDSDNDEVIHYAAAIMLLLQQTRSGGEHGKQHKKYWTEYFEQLVGSIHHLLNVLLVNYEETFEDSDRREELKLPELLLTNEPVARNVAATRRLLNLLKFLEMTIVGPYPVAKLMRVQLLIELIQRAMVVNSKILAKNAILDNLIVAALIPQIHCGFLKILDALVQTMRLNLRDNCFEINKLLEGSLQWTSTGISAGQRKPFTSLRLATYTSLEKWIETMGRSSLIESIAKSLVTNVIDDSKPYRSEITLQVNLTNNTKNLSKRAKKTLVKEQNEAKNLAKSHETARGVSVGSSGIYTDEDNRQLCCQALRLLTNLMDVSGRFISPPLHLAIQQHLSRLAGQVAEQQPDLRHLYYTGNCRNALYAALSSVCLNAHRLTRRNNKRYMSLID